MSDLNAALKKVFCSIHFASSLFIAVAITLLYSDISNHQILRWDDYKYVFDLKYLYDLSWENLLLIFTDFDNDIWYPITSLSYSINFALTGNNPYWFKLTNIFIHAANSIVLYFVVFKLFKLLKTSESDALSTNFKDNLSPTLVALITALLFALHTQHVEAVVWIVARKDLLCTFFYLLAILSYLNYREFDRNIWNNATLILFFLALLSKPMAMTLPAVLVLLDLFIFDHEPRLTRDKILKSIKPKLIMFVTSFVFAMISSFTQRNTIVETVDLSLTQKIINFLLAVWHYVYTIFNPSRLSPYYPQSELVTHPSTLSYILVIFSLLLLFLLYRSYKSKYYLVLLPILFFIITISPVAGFIKFSHAAYADRFTYIPNISLFVLLSWLITSIYNARRNIFARQLLPASLVIFLGFLGFYTVNYSKVWANDKALWEHVLTEFPYRTHVAYLNLGNFYYQQDDFVRANQLYHYAYAIDPMNMQTIKNMGNFQNKLGNDSLATYYFQMLAERHKNSANANIAAGDYFYNEKIYPYADHYYKTALQAEPGNIDALLKTIMMDYVTLRHDDALQKIKLLLQIDPQHIQALKLWVKIKLHQKNYKEVIRVSNLILMIEPEDEFANYMVHKYENNISKT